VASFVLLDERWLETGSPIDLASSPVTGSPGRYSPIAGDWRLYQRRIRPMATPKYGR
jgi:hypothetical protein